MLRATLERPANGWKSIGPYLRPDNEETAELFRANLKEDDFDTQGRVNYGGLYFADVYLNLHRLAVGLGIVIVVDGEVMSAEELYEASA